MASAQACKRAPAEQFTDRLWVSAAPSAATESFAAIAVTSVKGHSLGVLHRGSLYRGHWDMFGWQAGADKRATLEFLQDGRRHKLRWKTCSAPKGFDMCVTLAGDPSGVGTWYSKRHWALGERKEAKVGVAAGVELEAEVIDLLLAEVGDSPESGPDGD